MEEVFAEDKELLSRLEAVQKEMEHADETALKILSAKQESLLKRIAARDSYRYDVRIKTVLNGMGFQKTYRQTVATMSGGEKTRLKLCRLLLLAFLQGLQGRRIGLHCCRASCLLSVLHMGMDAVCHMMRIRAMSADST